MPPLAQEHEPGAVPRATCTTVPCTSAAFAELSAEVLRAGAALRFRARGTSMAPLVRDGDVVLVRPVQPGAVRAGDLVLGRCAPGQVVVHRVIGREAGPDGFRYTVQGDALCRPEGSIREAELYGRVETLERGGAQIDLDRPMVRRLGRLAALRSRWNLGRGTRFRWVRQWAKRLPGLSKYLA